MNAPPASHTDYKGFVAWFAAHPTAANLLMLIFIFMGLTTLTQLQRETFPSFSPTVVEISVQYPGATAEEVEEAVCQRIEDALDGIPNLKEIRSEAQENIAYVHAEMTDNGDLGQFMSDVKTEVEAIDDFPEDVEQPVTKQINRTDLVMSIAVSGPMSVPHLKLFCEELKDRLLQLPEVSQVDVLGFSEHQLRVEIPSFVLRQHGLSIQDVAQAIERQSVNLPAGTIETRRADILVRFADERITPRELGELLVVSSSTGAELPLGQIATITDRFELDEERILFNGTRAGILQINKAKDEDALRIRDAVELFVERERRLSPPTVQLTVTQDVSKIVGDRLHLLTVNGIQGLLLVFFSMWLFFSFRFSFWVVMGLPVSFLGAFFAMRHLGLSLNMITMVGLLLALGLLMDDAIVIAENVAAHLAKGKKALAAAIEGTTEVLPGVFSSYLTTVCIFGAIALYIAGDIGKVLWVMPLVLILTLTVSLVEAFCILPNHLAHSLRGKENLPPGRFRSVVNAGIDYAREKILGRTVDWALRWRYLFLGLVLGAFVASVGMVASGKLPTSPFPDTDGDVLMAHILLPQGTPLHRTEEVVADVVEGLQKANETLTPLQPKLNGAQQSLVQNVSIQYNRNTDAGESGPHVATVTADLLEAEKRNARLEDLKHLWRENVGQLPDVLSIAYKQPQVGPAGMAIDIRLQGSDLRRLDTASSELQDWLQGYNGVVDLHDDLRPGKPELRVTLREGALSLGLDAQTVARQLRAAFHGITAAEVQRGSEAYEIDVRLPRKDRDSLADLEYFQVTFPDGQHTPLRAIAYIQPGRGWARIARVDSVRTVTIQGDVDTRLGNANAIVNDTLNRFMPRLKDEYPDLRFELQGQSAEGDETETSLRTALIVGIFGIFVLLSFQFRSYIEPFIVIAAIPLALIGVIWGHMLMGYELTMPGILGFVSLAGVVVNDSILLVQFIKLNIQQGENPLKAATMASRMRFRAILLTSVTTILGLAPLMLEKSLQAQILIPLAVSIVFGLLASTLLVLLVVPALYLVLDDFGLAARITEEH